MITAIILAALQCPPSPWLTPELERYTVPGFGCDSRMYNVIDNAIYAAEEYYWTPISNADSKVCQEYDPNECTRAPCGGEANCIEPYLAETAICWVEETDCWESFTEKEMMSGPVIPDPVILRTYVLECSGSVNCRWAAGLPADFCCELLEVLDAEGNIIKEQEGETPIQSSC
jgi:hypothetical protein